ncbi:MAG: MFS transporter [Cyanobacteria bacterium P01_G01_bin.38]
MKFVFPNFAKAHLRTPWLPYAMGFFGLFLLNTALSSFILYRYDPGPNDENLPILVPTVLVGSAFFFGRIIGALLQPLVGYYSDQVQSQWGKRRPFLAVSILPMVCSFALLFNPVVTENSLGNSLYLASLLCIFYFAFTLYQVPYLAWLPELAPKDQQRVTLSSWLAISSLAATVVGATGTPWLSDRYGFGVMTMAIGSVGLGALLLPLLTPERMAEPSERVSLMVSLKASWQNSSFRPYVLGVAAAWISMSILSVCAVFFVTALLHKDISFSGLISILILGGAAFGMLGVKPLVKRVGKKRTFQFSMLWSGVGVILMALLPLWLGRAIPLWSILIPIGSLGLGGFFVLPNAMIPDVVEQDLKLGQSAQAVYFGSRGLFVELSTGLGTLIAGLLLSLGKTATHPLGVQLSLVTAGGFAFISAGLLITYPISR